MVSLGKPYQFNFLKGCVPQIILGPFLNTLTQMKNKNPARNAEDNFTFYCSSVSHFLDFLTLNTFNTNKTTAYQPPFA